MQVSPSERSNLGTRKEPFRQLSDRFVPSFLYGAVRLKSQVKIRSYDPNPTVSLELEAYASMASLSM